MKNQKEVKSVLRGSLSGLKTKEIYSYLKSIALDFDSNLKVISIKENFFSEEIKYEYFGYKENLEKIQNQIELDVIRDELHDLKSEYFVNKFDKSKSFTELKYNLNTKNFSVFKKLPERIAEVTYLRLEINKKSAGLFKGDDVELSVIGVNKKIKLFEVLFESFLKEENKNKKNKIF